MRAESLLAIAAETVVQQGDNYFLPNINITLRLGFQNPDAKRLTQIGSMFLLSCEVRLGIGVTRIESWRFDQCTA